MSSMGAQTKSEESCTNTLEEGRRRLNMCYNKVELIHTEIEATWVMHSTSSLGNSYQLFIVAATRVATLSPVLGYTK
jgi:hypothetical protein